MINDHCCDRHADYMACECPKFVLQEKIKNHGTWYDVGTFNTIEAASTAKRLKTKSSIYKYRIRQLNRG